MKMAFRHSFDTPGGLLDRRHFLTGALGCGATLLQPSLVFAGTEFWNAKDPSTWTEEEIVLLTSKSPWVREAVPNIKNAEDPTGGSVIGEGGAKGMGRRRASVTVIVRWESAQPILDALRVKLPSDFDGRYVLSVTNLPFANAPRGRGVDPTAQDDLLERIQNGATLEVKGKGTVEAGIVRRTHIGSILFGFAKDQLVLSPGDREIVFGLTTEQLSLKAKFDTKEMTYHGNLAV